MMKKALKLIFYAGVAVIVALFFLSLAGVVENNHGNSFGFPYKTAYTSFLLTMALIYAVITNGKVTPVGLAGYACLTGFVIWCGGKTDFVLLLVLTVFLALKYFKKIPGGKVKSGVLSGMRFGFIIICAVNYILVFSFRVLSSFWLALPGFNTFKDRLLYGLLAFEEYPITLFGTYIVTKGSYGETVSSLYFILDSAYVRCILERGVVPFVAVMTLLTAFMFFLWKRKCHVAMLALCLFAVDLAMNGIVLYLLLLLIFIVACSVKGDEKLEDILPSRKTLLVWLSFFCVSVLAIWGTGALVRAANNPGDITVDIGVTDQDEDTMEQVYNGLEAWEDAHPDIEVHQRARIRDYDLTAIAVMGAEHIPDVFIADCRLGRLLADEGLVVDLTDVAPDVGSFTYDDGVYAFPALLESYSVIIYDPLNWNVGDPVGFAASNEFTVINCYLSPLLGDEWGEQWLDHMEDVDGAVSFTDSEMITRIKNLDEMISDDIAYGSYDELSEAFIEGECPAVAVYGDYIYSILEDIKTNDPDLYDRVQFACMVDGVVPAGFEYGIFVREGMGEQETERCIDLAASLSSSVSRDSDETLDRLYDLVDNSCQIPLLTQCFTYNYWHFASNELYYIRSNGDKSPEDRGEMLQEYYDLYYVDYQ